MSRERTLDEVRTEIDSIDDAIQDLLIRRTGLVEEVRAIKRDWRVKIQPSREADIIYRLIQRHHGPFPKRDLVAIWRILICATLSFEGPFSVAVYVPREDDGTWDLARDHFGPCTPMSRHGSVRAVIEAVHRQDAIVGVLPMPRRDDADPWWRHLATCRPDTPRIIARLPFAGYVAGRSTPEALAICPISVKPTGRDRSFIVAEWESRLGLDRRASAAALGPSPELRRGLARAGGATVVALLGRGRRLARARRRTAAALAADHEHPAEALVAGRRLRRAARRRDARSAARRGAGLAVGSCGEGRERGHP